MSRRQRGLPALVDTSLGAAAASGATTGFVIGLVLGSLLGAAISWIAGALVRWFVEASYTMGVNVQLLPFGDRADVLVGLRDDWLLVIPACGLGVGLIAALIGALSGLLNTALARVLLRLPVRPREAVGRRSRGGEGVSTRSWREAPGLGGVRDESE